MQHELGDLESWLVNRSNRAENVGREIQRVNSTDGQVLLEKDPKIQEDSVTLILTFYLVLCIIFDISKSAHRIIRKLSNIKSHFIEATARVAFRNPKTLRDKLVRSKLRPIYKEERGLFICGRRNCDICNILEPGNELKSTVTGKIYEINFHFNCNSECVVYLLT